MNRVPDSISGGSIQAVQRWKEARESVAKVAGNKRSSTEAITMAIKTMEGFFK